MQNGEHFGMEDETYTDIDGKAISLECQSHSGFCREFTVSSAKVSISRVMVYTCAVWMTAYIIFFFTEVDHETLLVIGSLGVQVSSSYASGRESTDFIEMDKIKDIVINEAIHMQRVIYYLCILLKDPSDPSGVSSVVPLFQSSKPRLNCLVKVYRSCQEILAKC
ncbi:phosphatidylinositol N-acetylglucosaminyltransferase subunit H [Esox lucius]|uniref:Phosphatidylinositol N-acetylglucosaminyltransferase subunit H n=1 Tax=Esox lucius TaxID=8010 RepID=C1BXY9_ESOLU|nr:phosphatidylinositol N-acetylglucosaminyltransferase subunit H [Esox lucius]ACO13892.1 Phosphatidylinositol N-acetylglucosaminyltransferase subunit H [Esox lucius]